MRTLVAVALATLALPAFVAAQPEDRQRAPTGAAASASVDPCADAARDYARGPSTTWPGFDPRVPAPAGATSFTGIAPPGRDPNLGFPQPLQPDPIARACTQRLSR
jgi:hypothetical protein